MEISRSTLFYDAPVGTFLAQANVDCVLPLPAGTVCAAVLDAGASAQVTSAVPDEHGLTVTGTLLFRPLTVDGTGAPAAFSAAADFSHRIERKDLTEGMTASVAAELLRCDCQPADGTLRVRATVLLRAAVVCQVEAGVVACLAPAPGLEQLSCTLTTGQRRRLGGGNLLVRDEITLPHGFTVLRATGVPYVRTLAPAEGGVVLDGTLNLLILGLTPDGGLTEHPASVAFSDALRLDAAEQLTAGVSLVSLSVLRDDPDTDDAAAEATLEISVYGTAVTETPVLIDAYDPAQAFSCEQTTGAYLCCRDVWERREQIREQVCIPEGLPDAYMPVMTRVCPAVTNTADGSVDGVLLTTVVYRCDGGQYHSFTETLPFSVAVPDGQTAYDPRVRVLSAQASGSARAFDVRITLEVAGLICREERITYTTGISPDARAEPPTGVLLYFPDPEETLFAVGKRFSVPTEKIRQLNPDVTDPPAPGTKLVILR